MKTIEGPIGIVRERLLYKSLQTDTCIDLSKTILVANEASTQSEKYPLSVRWSEHRTTVTGLTVFGAQSVYEQWRDIKDKYDGDGIFFETAGPQKVSNAYMENVMDGYSPRLTSLGTLRDSWMVGVRDDAIENDGLCDVYMTNCLIEGCHVFYSTRPGSSSDEDDAEPIESKTKGTFENSLVWIKPMPNDFYKVDNFTIRESDGAKMACDWFFKQSAASGTVAMRNMVLRADQYHSRNKTSSMRWQAGDYENVTFCWTSSEPFLAGLPPGVTMIQGVEALEEWNLQRDRWVETNGWRFPNRSILKDFG